VGVRSGVVSRGGPRLMPVQTSRRHPVANRARAWNWYELARFYRREARAALERGDQTRALFWIRQARHAHERARRYQRALASQGGSLQ